MIDKGLRVRKGFFTAGQARGDDISPGTSTSGGMRDSGNGGNNREDRRSDQYGQQITTAQIGTLSDPREKQDYFDQSYVGPGPFGIGGGYRETVLPNTTRYGNKSRLGSLVASGIGALAGVPGLGFLSNLGPFDNRAFYDTKVLDAGKLDTSKYKDFDEYMAARMAGEIDAYGNPINSSGGGISTLPLFTQTPVSTGVETLEEEPQEMSFLERLRQNLGLV